MALPMRIINSKYSFKEAISYLETRGIESRPLIAGNLMKHPAAKQMNLKSASKNLDGANFHHEKSFYVGLTPYHTIEDIKKLLEILKGLDTELSL